MDREMNISSFSQKLVNLTKAVKTDNFYTEMDTLFKVLFEYDQLLIFLFNAKSRPKLIYSDSFAYGEVQNKELEGEEKWNYLTTIYVLDPFYRKGIDGQSEGAFRLRDIAPDNFLSSDEVFAAYHNSIQVNDESGYLIQLENNYFIHIVISRMRNSKDFSTEELQLFEELFETIKSLVLLHEIHNSTNDNHNGNVEAGLLNFGKEVLTQKEYQACQLMLHGHSTKAMASIMGIGLETVKMHKKNVYGKTFVSGQSELLALFIEILSIYELIDDKDYLKIYLDKC